LACLQIALFDAGTGAPALLADRLRRSLAEAGINSRVATFTEVKADSVVAGFDAVFLRGLLQSDRACLLRRVVDESIRAALCNAGIAYQVIYGNDEESLVQVMRATENLVGAAPVTALQSQVAPPTIGGAVPWVWLCDKCSDPQCEHRLLTDLIKQRQPRP
jgi:hypothetical protein